MKNILIVEGKTDKKFLESYIDHLRKTFPREIFEIDDIKNATGQNGISRILKPLKIKITTREIKNIGILIDADNVGINAKIKDIINPAIKEAFKVENAITTQNQKFSVTYNENSFNIFCHIFNLNGKGELEDILMKIRTDKTLQAPRCLEAFVQCMEGFNIAYPEKEYKKNWVYFYGYESLKKESLSIEETKSKLNNDEYYTSKYWDFESTLLNDLKQFLNLFQ